MSLDDLALDGVIAGLYAAAAGERRWDEVLGQVVQRFRCWGVQLFGLRLADGGLSFSHEAGFPPEGLLHYVRYYHRVDPRTPLLQPLALGQWWHCHEHFDDAFVAREPLYQELIIPYGGRYSSGIKLYQDEEELVVVGVHRPLSVGPLAGEDLTAMHRLGLHLQHAVGLWQRQRRTQRQALAGEAIVSRLSQPVLLVDAGGHVRHGNAAGQALLARGLGLQLRDGRLACTTAAAHAELQQALQRLGLGETALDRRSHAPARVVLRIGQAPHGVLLMLSALQPEETMAAFGAQRLALVLMHDLAHRQTPDPLLVCTAFGLTPAEGQVACQVAGGLSPHQIAATSGVSVHTVRAQLTTAYEKVGVRRQAELAAALAGFTGL